MANSQKVKKWVVQAGDWGLSDDCQWHKGYKYPFNPRYDPHTDYQDAQKWRTYATKFDRYDRPTVFQYYKARVYNKYYYQQYDETEHARLTQWIDSFHKSLQSQFDDVASAAEWQDPPEELVQFCCDRMDQFYDGTETIGVKWNERPGQLFKATQVGSSLTRKQISQTPEWEKAQEIIHRASDYIQHGPKSIRAIENTSTSRPAQAGASSSSSSRNQSNPQRTSRHQQDNRGRPQGSRSSYSTGQSTNVHVSDDIDVYSTSRRSRSSTQWNEADSRSDRRDSRSERHESGRGHQDRPWNQNWDRSKDDKWYRQRRQ